MKKHDKKYVIRYPYKSEHLVSSKRVDILQLYIYFFYNNIKKKDDPLPATKKQEQGKVDDLITRVNKANVKLEKINGSKPQGK